MAALHSGKISLLEDPTDIHSNDHQDHHDYTSCHILHRKQSSFHLRDDFKRDGAGSDETTMQPLLALTHATDIERAPWLSTAGRRKAVASRSRL
jgi:hypothetical protein